MFILFFVGPVIYDKIFPTAIPDREIVVVISIKDAIHELKKEEPKSVSVETGVQTETEKPKINYVLFQRDYSRAHKKDNKPVPKKEIEDAFKKAGGTIKEKPQCSTESNAVTKNLKKNIAKLAEGGEVIITYKKK